MRRLTPEIATKLPLTTAATASKWPHPFPGQYPTRCSIELADLSGQFSWRYIGKPSIGVMEELHAKLAKLQRLGPVLLRLLEFDRKNLISVATRGLGSSGRPDQLPNCPTILFSDFTDGRLFKFYHPFLHNMCPGWRFAADCVLVDRFRRPFLYEGKKLWLYRPKAVTPMEQVLDFKQYLRATYGNQLV